jgi:hypothetical protein
MPLRIVVTARSPFTVAIPPASLPFERGRTVVLPSFQNPNNEREHDIGQEGCRCGRLVRTTWRSEEDIGLDHQHQDAGDRGREPSHEAAAEVQVHYAKEKHGLEAERQRRYVPQAKADFRGVVVQRQVLATDDEVEDPMREYGTTDDDAGSPPALPGHQAIDEQRGQRPQRRGNEAVRVHRRKQMRFAVSD